MRSEPGTTPQADPIGTWLSRIAQPRAILAVLVLLGAGMVAFLLPRHPHVSGDTLRYLFPIYNLLDGEGYTYRGKPELLYPPGLGFAAYPIAQIVGDVGLSGALLSALCYVLLIPAVYWAASILYDKRTAVLSAVFIAFTPWMLRFSYKGLTDVPYSLLYVTAFALCCRALSGRSSTAGYILLGSVLGVAYLVRPEAFVPAALTLLGLFAFSLWGPSTAGVARTRGASLLRPAAATATFLLLISPYLVFMKDQVGRWTLSTKTTANLIIGERAAEGQDRLAQASVEYPNYLDARFELDIFDYIQSRGSKFPRRIATNFVNEMTYLGGVALHAAVPFALVVALALVTGHARSLLELRRLVQPLWRGLPFLIFLSPLALILIFLVRPRHVLPYAPLLLILMARGITLLLAENRWLERRRWAARAELAAAALSLCVAAGLVSSQASLYRVLTSPPLPSLASVTAAGGWLAERTDDPAALTLVGVGPGCGDMILYHAGRGGMPSGTFIPIEYGTALDDAAELLRDGTADYLVLTRECGYPFTPEIMRIWDTPELSAEVGLSLEHRDDEGFFQVYTAAGREAAPPGTDR